MINMPADLWLLGKLLKTDLTTWITAPDHMKGTAYQKRSPFNTTDLTLLPFVHASGTFQSTHWETWFLFKDNVEFTNKYNLEKDKN